MKRITPNEKRIVPALTNPRPNFASLVRHGANQRPFHTVKRADQAAKQEKEMPKSIATKADAALKIHRIVFNAAEFPTEDAVKGFLTEKGYADFTIAPVEGGGFSVEDNAADAFKGELRTVPHSSVKGVSYIVGDPKDDTTTKSADPAEGEDTAKGEEGTEKGAEGTEGADTPATPAADAAKGTQTPAPAASEPAPAADTTKTAEPRQRTRFGLVVAGKSMNQIVAAYEGLTDHTDAEVAKDATAAKSFADMLANYTGGMPPGMYDMADAMMGELRRMMKAGDVDEKKVSTLATDFTRGVMAMHGAFTSIMANTSKSAGAAPDMEALDALLDMLFAEKSVEPSAPGAKSDDMTPVVESLAALSEKTNALQKAVDGMALLMIEQGQVAAKASQVQEPARVIPERKSVEVDEAGAAKTADAQAAAKADTDRRAAKRLGFSVER